MKEEIISNDSTESEVAQKKENVEAPKPTRRAIMDVDETEGMSTGAKAAIFGVIILIVAGVAIFFLKKKRVPSQATLEESVPFKFSMQNVDAAHEDLSRHGFSPL